MTSDGLAEMAALTSTMESASQQVFEHLVGHRYSRCDTRTEHPGHAWYDGTEPWSRGWWWCSGERLHVSVPRIMWQATEDNDPANGRFYDAETKAEVIPAEVARDHNKLAALVEAVGAYSAWPTARSRLTQFVLCEDWIECTVCNANRTFPKTTLPDLINLAAGHADRCPGAVTAFEAPW